jgi:hypothetical protein
MHLPYTSFMNTAACGALVGGASVVDSGIAPGLVVVDSNRPAVFAPKPAATAGIATGLLMQSIAPI